jgi:hypothetical protein
VPILILKKGRLGLGEVPELVSAWNICNIWKQLKWILGGGVGGLPCYERGAWFTEAQDQAW